VFGRIFYGKPVSTFPENALIVTADDFGLAPEVNEAVEIAHRTGILSAASLMVASPGAADAVRRARMMPSLRVGLHLVLVEATPALPPEQIPDLVTRDGQFRTDMAGLGFDLAFRPKVRRQMVAEITAQFEAFRATGLPLDHVNGHKHFHLHPMIGAAAIAIGQKFGARGIRVPTEPVEVIRAIEPAAVGASAALMAQWTRVLRAQARRAGMMAPDAVFGLAWSGAMTRERMRALLTKLPPGLVEIYTHPAAANEFIGHAPGYRYVDELAALTDADCVASARAAAHRPGGFADA
jgi:hopanoid biosynthesis associated protein HpnK